MDQYLQGLFVLADDPASEVRKLVTTYCPWSYYALIASNLTLNISSYNLARVLYLNKLVL